MQGVSNVKLEDKLGIGNGKLSGNKDDLRDKCWKRKNWRKNWISLGCVMI